MTWSVAARLARRELRGGLRGFRVLLSCLALGVAAIAAVGVLRDSIAAGLAANGAELLGGDAEIELIYRRATPAERSWMEAAGTALTEIVEFRSMVGTAGGRRLLTQVKAVDDAFPLLGDVTLDPPMPLDRAFAGQGNRPGVLMAPELVLRLGLEPGDEVTLGTKRFVLAATLKRLPDAVSSGFAPGPVSLVRSVDLAGSGLLQAGTLFETEYKLRLAPQTDLDALSREASERLEGARWRDRRDGAPGLAEFARRLSAFLMLVGLSGLAVGGVGVSSAVTTYLASKTETIGTLKTLGADAAAIRRVYAIQIGAVVVLGVALGLALGASLPLALAPLIEARLPVPAIFRPWPAALAEAAAFGCLAGAIFTLWPLARVEEVRAAQLFRHRSTRPGHWPRLRWLAAVATAVAALVLVAGWRSGLWSLTFWSFAGLLAAFAMLWLVGRAIETASRRLAARARRVPILRLALGGLGGQTGEVRAVVISLGVGLTVLSAIAQIDWNLRSAITRDLPEVAPVFFMLDIQPDQIDAFRADVTTAEGVTGLETAPMLRGIITEINGRPAVEVAGNHWTLQGDRGVTYSDALPPGTRIDAGQWWDADYDGEPLLSFATEEGAELGLGLGDQVTVNILGRDVTARVANFREVDFSTIGMGFVMSMNPAALRGAPHTHIATIYADGGTETEATLLDMIADRYPNVTAISVGETISGVAEILAGIAAAITWGAVATMSTGVVVVLGAAAATRADRSFEAAILKTLGAERSSILAVFALRSALSGTAAGLVAVVAGGLAAWALTSFFLETDFVLEPFRALVIVAAGTAATLLAGLAFAWVPLAVRPARVLRAGE